jgi:hypothetical protein
MADKPQTFATHRRFIPAFHFFVLPVLYINVIVVGYFLVRYPNLVSFWRLLVAIALATGMSWLRFMPLRAQDRIIRLEERARLERVLPTDMRGRIGELTPSQLIAIRFAEDEEVADLTRRTLNGELKTPGEIKRAIRNWRSDHLRV